MLKRQLSRSASICDGFRQLHFTHLGRGFLPLLAVMLLATPQLAFANGLTIVTVNPIRLDINETGTARRHCRYTVVFWTPPNRRRNVTVDWTRTGAVDDPVTNER